MEISNEVIEEFETHFSMGGEDDCWNWFGPMTLGYGQFRLRIDGTRRANRISYMIYKGSIPKGMLICHSCDNKACVNPNHLSVGTHKDNHDQASERGLTATGIRHGAYTKPERRAKGDNNGARKYPERLPRGDKHYSKTNPEKLKRGEKNHNSKITEEIVRIIRNEYRPGQRGQPGNIDNSVELGVRFGIHPTSVREIVRRVTWRHVV